MVNYVSSSTATLLVICQSRCGGGNAAVLGLRSEYCTIHCCRPATPTISKHGVSREETCSHDSQVGVVAAVLFQMLKWKSKMRYVEETERDRIRGRRGRITTGMGWWMSSSRLAQNFVKFSAAWLLPFDVGGTHPHAPLCEPSSLIVPFQSPIC